MIGNPLYASELACTAARFDPLGEPHAGADCFCSMCARTITRGTPATMRSLPKSFSDHETLRPSDYICGWCAAIIPQKILRGFQRAVITKDGVYNLNKDEARAWLWLTPPEPPFAVVIHGGSALAAFHYIWRTPVTMDKRLIAVNFDGTVAHVKHNSITRSMQMLDVLRKHAVKDGQKKAVNSPFRNLDRANFANFNSGHGRLSEVTLSLAEKFDACREAADFFTNLNNADLTALSALLKANPVAPVKPALLQGNQIFEKVEIEAA